MSRGLAGRLVARLRAALEHQHAGHIWDGFYEHCRCGASAFDRRDRNGMRCIFFADWPKQ